MSETSYKKKKAQKEKPGSFMKELIGNIIYIAVICLIVFLILKYVGQRTQVNGDSMDTTLADGQSLIMDKLSYRFHDPKRFDIVIFPGPEEEAVEGGMIDRILGRETARPYFIKRVIGLPGETIQILDGKVYIDGSELTDDIYGITDYIDDPGIAEEPLTLASDEYFCMGDNRPVSFDSRYEEVGPVKKSEFIGKVWIRIWPLNLFGKVR